MNKQSNQRVFLLLSGLFATIILIGITVYFVNNEFKKNRILFTELSTTELNAYKGILGSGEVSTDNNLQASLVVSKLGLKIKENKTLYRPIPNELSLLLPPSLRTAAIGNNDTLYAIPLQLDHFEMAWNSARFQALNIDAPNTMVALKNALAKENEPSVPAILFAGSDDEVLLLVFSVLCTSKLGVDSYYKAVSAIQAGQSFSEVCALALNTDSKGNFLSLNTIIELMQSWKALGYLHPEWHKLKDSDIKGFMESGNAFIVLEPLSFHRTVAYNSIKDFQTTKFPNETNSTNSALVAPITVAFMPLNGSEAKAKESLAILTKLTNAERLAELTGQSTTMSGAKAADVQAADALSWAAGSNVVVNGFYRDAFRSKEEAHKFAESLREKIKGE